MQHRWKRGEIFIRNSDLSTISNRGYWSKRKPFKERRGYWSFKRGFNCQEFEKTMVGRQLIFWGKRSTWSLWYVHEKKLKFGIVQHQIQFYQWLRYFEIVRNFRNCQPCLCIGDSRTNIKRNFRNLQRKIGK